MELNLLSFVPLIASTSNIYSSEGALKYFLIQALGSALILAAAPGLILTKYMRLIPVILALLIKIGAAPFHFWFPAVIQGIQWNQALILITVQKLAPLLLLSHTTIKNSFICSYIIVFSSILSALVGRVGGLNQTLLRKIITYSSINHLAWILAASSIQESLFSQYFVIYSIVSSSVVLILISYQIFHFNQILQISSSNTLIKVCLFSTLFSLGGLPPFLGFIPKLIVLQNLTSANQFVWLAFLLLSSIITLIFYIRLLLSGLILTNIKVKSAPLKKETASLLFFAVVNLTPFIFPLLTFIPF